MLKKSDQVVHRVFRAALAHLNKPSGEGRHHMTHEVVPKGETLCLQHLLLLRLDLRELGALGGRRENGGKEKKGKEGKRKGEG